MIRIIVTVLCNTSVSDLLLDCCCNGCSVLPERDEVGSIATVSGGCISLLLVVAGVLAWNVKKQTP